MINVKNIVTVLSVVALMTTTSAIADSKTEVSTQQVVKKNAKKLLSNSYSYLASLQKYSFEATVVDKVEDYDSSMTLARKSSVKIDRPSKFRVDSKSKFIDRTSYLSDGKFTMIDNSEKYYATVETKKNINKTLEYIGRKLGIAMPLATLMRSDMTKVVKIKRVQYFGTRDVYGVECNYIAFKHKKSTVHLWIENSDTPLIRAATIITPSSGKTDIVVNWDITPNFSDSIFVFNAPKNASNISIIPAK